MTRRYYFRTKENKWSKRLNLIRLLYLVLVRKVGQFETIWHTGLCPEGKTNPDKCIHPSIQLRELPFLPNWVFKKGFGVSEVFERVTKNAKTLFSKEVSFEKFVEKPLEIPTGLKDITIKKIVIPSIRAIHNLSSGGEYSIDLVYSTTDNEQTVKSESYQTVIKETESNYLEFQIIIPTPPNVGGVLYQESYGLNNELHLKNEKGHLRVLANSVTNFSTNFPNAPQILKGQFTQINQVVDSNYRNTFLRLIIPTTDTDIKSPLSILERNWTVFFDKEEFNVHQSLMGIRFRTGSGVSEITVNENKFHYYSIDESIIVLECLNRTDINSFKLEAEQIRLALAFLCGNLYRGEAYYVSSDSANFSEIEGVWYEKELPEIITNNQIINPRHFFQSFQSQNEDYQKKNKKHHVMFSNALFSSLCDLMITNTEIQRAIKLIVNASNNSDSIQKGALYSVAIETLTGFFTEKNKESLKPVKDSTAFTKLEKEVLDVIESNLAEIGKEGAEILRKKISNLNSPTNRDKLIKPFEIYKLKLSEDNIKTIDKRNKYLHGQIPLKTDEKFELNKLALELHFLAACLILKYIGYEGHVIDLPTWAIFKNEEKFRELVKNKTQEEMRLINQLKDSLEKRQIERFSELKTQLLEFYASHEIRNLIKII